MAVYERRFRPYVGPRTALGRRWSVVSRYALADQWGSKVFLASLVVALTLPVIVGLLIYLRHNASALDLLQINVGDLLTIDGAFFLAGVLVPQQWAALWMALLVGPRLITVDLAAGALPLYLGRPLSRRAYVLGKAAALAGLLSLITWIPGSLLWLLQAGLEGGGWAGENLRILGALLGASWIWIILLTSLSLALSAWVRWRPVAQLFLLGMLTVPVGFGRAINGILELKRDWGVLISPSDILSVIRAGLFGPTVQNRIYIDLPDIPLVSAWLAFGLICGTCILLLRLKIKAFEVVR
jgi:ABC-2 type transport system permease protein